MMHEESSHESTSSSSPPDLLVDATDFDVVDFEAPIRGQHLADLYKIFTLYRDACIAAEAKNSPTLRVYRLLTMLCSIQLYPDNKESPWLPMFSFGTRQTATPADFAGAQTAILASVVPKIQNTALKARLADIAWSNNRQDGRSAAAAIEAYCDTITGVVNGSLHMSQEHTALREVIPFLHRAMHIAKASTSRNKRPPKVAHAFDTMRAATKNSKDIEAFVRLTTLGLDYNQHQPATAALELEELASNAPLQTYPISVKKAWDLAARLYHNLKDKEGRQRCLKAAVQQALAMRNEVRGSPAAEAGWVMDALQQLRHIDGEEKLEYDLEIELRRLQKAQLKQIGTFHLDLHLEDAPEKIAEHFVTLSLSDALKQFGTLGRSPDPEKLRQEALRSRDISPLASRLACSYIDNEGRITSKSSGAPNAGEPDETWFIRYYNQHETIRRARLVRAAINPARLAIQTKFGIEARHFNALIGMCSLIPDSQKPIVTLGFTRLFQGDMVSAAHLVLPQLEPCLRNILRINGYNPSKRRDDDTEEDLSLGALLLTFRTELEQILTPPIVFEINLLFNAKPGPEVRHELAHGQISANYCFNDVIIYACWFMYHMCSLFMLQDWDDFVASQLAEEA